MLHIGGEWQWLVRQAGRDVAKRPRALLLTHGAQRKPLRSSSAEMAFLTRTDPARNIDRFYSVDVTPTLFGEWAVLREWGRRGSPGTDTEPQ